MKTTVSIPGMHCESCAAMIKDVSGDFSEIKHINVDVTQKRVELEHEENFDVEKWKEEIESLGDTYKVHPLSA